MSWGSRLCRACGTRFAPIRIDERTCRACSAGDAELQLVVRYIRDHPTEVLTRVALATGVSEDAIRSFARGGLLDRIPFGAEPERECACPPERPGTCPACRSALAAQLREAVGEQLRAGPAEPPIRGMTTRKRAH